MYADVIVDISVEALDKTYQYHIPQRLEGDIGIGTPVKVPFGRGNRVLGGFVLNLTEKPAYEVERIKDILAVEKKQVSVEGQLLQMAAFIRERYGSTMNEALKTVLPIKKKIKSVEEHWLNFAIDKSQIPDILHEYERKHYVAKVRLLKGMLDENGTMTRRTADLKYKVTQDSTYTFLGKTSNGDTVKLDVTTNLENEYRLKYRESISFQLINGYGEKINILEEYLPKIKIEGSEDEIDLIPAILGGEIYLEVVSEQFPIKKGTATIYLTINGNRIVWKGIYDMSPQ